MPPTAAAHANDRSFAHGPDARIFRFGYQGEPRPLRDYLLERYRYGRGEAWARDFYPERVRLNGQPVGTATWVRRGDEVAYRHLRCEEPSVPSLAAALYEDDWLLALFKSDAAPVNPSGVYYYTCLAIQAREALANPELTPVHRLDLETSGPVLFAKRKAYLPTLHRLFQRKALRKRYRALVHGAFPIDLRAISGHIGPDPDSRIHTKLRLLPVEADGGTGGGAVAEGCTRTAGNTAGDTVGCSLAEPSLTRVLGVVHRDLGGRGVISELLLEPVTGKTNQLRVHLAHVGHPIVGDKKYHPDEEVFLDWFAHRNIARLRQRLLLPRHALHCESLDFPHPFTDEAVEVRAPAGAWAAKVAGLADNNVP